jgi:hypothetical protein
VALGFDLGSALRIGLDDSSDRHPLHFLEDASVLFACVAESDDPNVHGTIT